MYASLSHYKDLAVLADEWYTPTNNRNPVNELENISKMIFAVRSRSFSFSALFVVATEKRKELDTPTITPQPFSSREKHIHVIVYFLCYVGSCIRDTEPIYFLQTLL